MSERLWYLKRCDLFQRLSPAQLGALESSCRMRQFARGTPIYLPADSADSVLLLAQGRVKIGSYTEEGKQTILAFIEPGELFGELSLMGTEERDEYAEAVDKSTIILIPNEVMQGLLEENPAVSLGVTKLFGLRRQRIEKRLKYLLFRSNRERLVHLLLELAEKYGRQALGGVELRIKLSHQDLASIVGSTRETVTVVLGELQSEGLLELGRRKIKLTDLARLAASVNIPTPRLSGV
ncbi:MAG: Crp/Fnr family transcriptional regulator [Planctomycetales bacterium]|nr:Crp/Fnr family transcriptional regulator [Planctomycetales bacterium]